MSGGDQSQISDISRRFFFFFVFFRESERSWPVVRFSEAPKLFGSISGTIYHTVSWKTKQFLNMKLCYKLNISYLKDTAEITAL